MFAPNYDRNEHGHILFPRDKAARDKIFTKESFEHPAKMNLYLLQEIVKYTTQPGDVIIDITAGSGTILWAGTVGRLVIAVELNPQFCEWMKLNAAKMGVTGYLILEGDCRQYLPLACNAIIFSPPYANLLNAGGGILDREHVGEQYREYSKDPRNLGALPEFRFNEAMRTIYQKCLDSLSPGGILTLIIKDTVNLGVINPLGWRHVQMMGLMGFEMFDWQQWVPPGTQFKALHKARGTRVVETEHCIMMRRPL